MCTLNKVKGMVLKMNNIKFKLKANICKRHNTSQQKVRKSLKVMLVIAVSVFLSMTSISIVYAKTNNKIKEGTNLFSFSESKTINNYVSYIYEPKEIWQNKDKYGVSEECIGVYSININGTVKINEIDSNLKISSINDLENKIGIKLLKAKNTEYKYFNVFNTSTQNEKYNNFINNPAIISITMSSYENFDCNDFIYLFNEKTPQKKIDEHNKCQKDAKTNRSNRRLNMRIMFATQYASKEQIENMAFYLAEFPNEKVEIYNSKKLNSKIFITTMDEYIFVYDNITYVIDNSNHDYSKDELLHIIESMEY